MFLKKFAAFVILILLVGGFMVVNFRLREGFNLDGGWFISADYVTIKIRDEGNLVSGHNTIGIDEDYLSSTGKIPLLPFSLLSKWRYDPKTQPPCPDKIMAEDGKRVKVVGFMYPLESGDMIRSFCLLRTTQTCCYGPRPQWSQYLFVETETPVPFVRFAPVSVTGKFIVDPKPKQGYVYRFEATSVVVVDQ